MRRKAGKQREGISFLSAAQEEPYWGLLSLHLEDRQKAQWSQSKEGRGMKGPKKGKRVGGRRVSVSPRIPAHDPFRSHVGTLHVRLHTCCLVSLGRLYVVLEKQRIF